MAAGQGTSMGRVLQMCSRALLRRCPWCGGRGLFRGWFKTVAACPTCGLPLERGESDFFYGAYMFNLIAAELLFALLFVVMIVWTYPNTPWSALKWAGVAVAVVAPVITYPIAKLVWLAFDLAFRPWAGGPTT